MSDIHFTKHLKEGEELVAVIKRYVLAYAVPLCIGVVLILVPFFFLYPLFRAGAWGIYVWFFLLVVAIVYGARQTFIYFRNALIITNQRIIDFDQKGFFNQSVSEMAYDKIQDVSYSIHGIFQTFFRYGEIEIQSAGTQTNIEIQNVFRPERVKDLIVEMKNKTLNIQSRTDEKLTAQELVEMVATIRKGLGEKQFEELLRKKKGKN